MSKRALAFLIGGVIAIGGGAAAIASTVGGSDSTSHKMSNGQTMSGSHMMGDGSSMDSMSGMDDSGK